MSLFFFKKSVLALGVGCDFLLQLDNPLPVCISVSLHISVLTNPLSLCLWAICRNLMLQTYFKFYPILWHYMVIHPLHLVMLTLCNMFWSQNVLLEAHKWSETMEPTCIKTEMLQYVTYHPLTSATSFTNALPPAPSAQPLDYEPFPHRTWALWVPEPSAAQDQALEVPRPTQTDSITSFRSQLITYLFKLAYSFYLETMHFTLRFTLMFCFDVVFYPIDL